MGVLLWLLVPIAATAAAGLWLSRRGRIATPEEHERGISEMDRFREAMRKPIPKHDER